MKEIHPSELNFDHGHVALPFDSCMCMYACYT